MLALFAAAAMTTTVAAGPAVQARPQLFFTAPPAGQACKTNGRYEIADPALLYREDGKAKMSTLGKLPKANYEKAVLRVIDGCTAPLVVRYQAGR